MCTHGLFFDDERPRAHVLTSAARPYDDTPITDEPPGIGVALPICGDLVSQIELATEEPRELARTPAGIDKPALKTWDGLGRLNGEGAVGRHMRVARQDQQSGPVAARSARASRPRAAEGGKRQDADKRKRTAAPDGAAVLTVQEIRNAPVRFGARPGRPQQSRRKTSYSAAFTVGRSAAESPMRVATPRP